MPVSELYNIYEHVSGILEQIELEENNSLIRADRSMTALEYALNQVREIIIQTPFASEEEEINFFKVDKPKLAAKLVFFRRVYEIERHRPHGTQESQIAYMKSAMMDVDSFYKRYPEFHDYYENGMKFLDEQYFVRGKQDPKYLIDADWMHSDPGFSTGYDQIVSIILANEELINYLNLRIEVLSGKSSPPQGDERPDSIKGFAQTPFRGQEVYVFLKSLIDSQAVVNHTYKSFFELIVPGIANMQQRSFIPSSLLKYSDKVDPETRENVKRLLQKMIRNIDSY